jgi:hypothetical protein
MIAESIAIDGPAAARAAEDLFVLGRRAAAARDAAFGRRATFVRTRQLLATSTWRGPRDAAESYVDEGDLAALGGWPAARAAGVTLLVAGRDPGLARAAAADGARVLWRIAFRNGEAEGERLARLGALAAVELSLWGLLPAPEGEPYGLDTVRFVALCRLAAPAAWHVAADGATLGPRLAQMCLGFGADELRAPIVGERALRLGANANNPALTRKEAVTLIRGAGLPAAERFADGRVEEVT